jgi:hypothetical protein
MHLRRNSGNNSYDLYAVGLASAFFAGKIFVIMPSTPAHAAAFHVRLAARKPGISS